MLIDHSGVKIKRQLKQDLTVHSKAIALKADKPLEDIQELHPLISLNMVVCLNSKDLNLPDRWLTSSLQPNMVVNKVDTVAHPNSHPLVMEDSRLWAMAVPLLLAPVVTGAANRRLTLSGVRQLFKVLATASRVVTRDRSFSYDLPFHASLWFRCFTATREPTSQQDESSVWSSRLTV
jgi:hypothetical protein